MHRFGFTSFLGRLLFAAVLVFATYNPSGYSFYHWVFAGELSGLHLLAAVALLIGWVVCLRATWNSLGIIGVVLAGGFFGALVWLAMEWGVIQGGGLQTAVAVAEAVLAGVLAVGLSWSHIRRRISGQYDTDELPG